MKKESIPPGKAGVVVEYFDFDRILGLMAVKTDGSKLSLSLPSNASDGELARALRSLAAWVDGSKEKKREVAKSS